MEVMRAAPRPTTISSPYQKEFRAIVRTLLASLVPGLLMLTGPERLCDSNHHKRYAGPRGAYTCYSMKFHDTQKPFRNVATGIPHYDRHRGRQPVVAPQNVHHGKFQVFGQIPIAV